MLVASGGPPLGKLGLCGEALLRNHRITTPNRQELQELQTLLACNETTVSFKSTACR